MRNDAIIADLLGGMKVREVAEKYHLSKGQVHRIQKQRLGGVDDRRFKDEIAQIKERIKTIESILDLYFKERLRKAGL
jgi:hypothetical protein